MRFIFLEKEQLWELLDIFPWTCVHLASQHILVWSAGYHHAVNSLCTPCQAGMETLRNSKKTEQKDCTGDIKTPPT